MLARLDVGEGPRLWKYARAYRRSQVGDPADASRLPERCEEELYDLEADPLETENLARLGHRSRASRAAEDQLSRLITEMRATRAIHPRLR